MIRSQHERQLVIDLPDLTGSDLIDMVRVLQAITDAFIAQHQVALQRQQRQERQLELFLAGEDQQIPF